MPEVIRQTHPFNGAVESGLRTLFLLSAFPGIAMGLEHLAYFDYLLVHSGDVANGPESLHPAVPHRGGEWMTRRQYVEKGLEILVSRELALKRFTTDGIVYSTSDLATSLLKYFNTDYASLFGTCQ